ncbi:MAG: transglycosylase SLT domain-containing protein [Woeseiaceae bacterium]
MQRAAFVDAWPRALEGELPVDRDTLNLLADYPLWPDLKAAVYSDQLEQTGSTELDVFLTQYASLAPIRRLRYRRTLRLGKLKAWQRYLPIYEQHYADANLPALDCLALQGYLSKGDRTRSETLSRTLWLTGKSQHDFCDTPFANLLKNGVIDASLIEARMQLAVRSRQFGLANYLAGMLNDDTAKATVRRWRQSVTQPTDTLKRAVAEQTALTNEQLVAAVRKRALSDAPAAAEAFEALRRKRDFKADVVGQTLRHIAIGAAQDHEPSTLAIMDRVPDAFRDQRLLEWRARMGLLNGDWTLVSNTIAAMSEAERGTDRWRYWAARALLENGDRDNGTALMSVLATERSYYGFLAADQVGQDYAFAHRNLAVDETAIRAIGDQPDIIRARELWAVEQPKRAQQEWQRAVRKLDRLGKRDAAILAHRWQQHREAIALLGELKAWDDLDIRYPLAYRETIELQSKRVGIPNSLTMGIVRSESLYDPTARSSAGAWGLMQLIPSTGKRMAQKTGIRWQGVDTLKNPNTNITLGAQYLAQLTTRFGQPALAAAAYNAGPHRVDRWLPQVETVPADIWIEAIAYDETRAYVQRVLGAAIVFRWRLEQDVGRLSDSLQPVKPKQSAATTASRL